MNHGVQFLALTNINCTADHWDFYTECKNNDIKPILGTEIRNGDELLYVLLAKNINGVQQINDFISGYLMQKIYFPAKSPALKDVWIIYPLAGCDKCSEENELVGVQPSEATKLFTRKHLLPKCVIRQPVTFKDKRTYNIHRLLRAIDKNILLSLQLPSHIAVSTETFLTSSELFKAFDLYPQIITNTLKIGESCNYEIELHADKNKEFYTASLEDDRKLLEKLAFEGMIKRFGPKNTEAHKRVKKELEIINKLRFNAYFLITWDVIRYAQNRGFFYVGRGSGANSIVAYCLQITDVNPIELDLYFERFLNPYRTSPPDFDLDFSWKDRDEVIDYIFKRYGKEYVCLLGMYSTFKRRAAIRELAKVFGLPKSEIDALANDKNASFTSDKIQKQIKLYGDLINGFPNHLSIHPGGMLISQKPITNYTAVTMPPKGFITSQIDMFIAEDVGLYKLDILSQRGLGHIKETVQLVKENRGISIDIHNIEEFLKDKKVAGQIRNADTIGCFYIESPAMRQLLKKLQCNDYITLVAASSIIRPGVAQSGMMRQYIYSYHHPNSVKYLHPKMEELLKETYGVMVFQEDVIKVAHHFAGLDMGEADVLRRAMSGKYRGGDGFLRIKDKFFLNCKERGYTPHLTAEVWRQIESFAGYSFSKAHSASFAVESYQSLYLKTYFPLEFMVAVINNFGGFYSTELYFHELKRAGGILHSPCINESRELTSLNGNDVYIGFIHIHNLEQNTISIILNERNKGLFKSLEDIIVRTQLSIEQLCILIRANSLKFTNKSKKELLWEAHYLHKQLKGNKTEVGLFNDPIKDFNIPELNYQPFENVLDEIELFGFPLCDSFDLVNTDFSDTVTAADFDKHIGKTVAIVGYYITAKPVRTVKNEYMYFGTFLDRNGEWIDSVHFPDVATKYALQGNGFYKVKGKIVEEFTVCSIEVHSMEKLGLVAGMVEER